MRLSWWALLVLVVAIIVTTHQYATHSADRIAAFLGYFLALGLIPMLAGLVIGLGAAFVAGRMGEVDRRIYVVYPVVCAAASLVLIGYALFRMS